MKVYEVSFETEPTNIGDELMLFSDYQKAKEKVDDECDRFCRNAKYDWRLDEEGAGDGVRLYDLTDEFENMRCKYHRSVGIDGYEQVLEWIEAWIVEREVL